MLIFQPGVVAHGHHQPEGTIGFRAAQVRFQGWTLHLVTIYLDCNYGMQEGPNLERTQGVINLIKATRLVWVTICDFNKTPEEVAESVWCKFLKKVVLAPDLHFTCTGNGSDGGRLIDFAIADRRLAPYLSLEGIEYGFKPHVYSLRLTVHLNFAPDAGKLMRTPSEIHTALGPREYGDDWAKHWLEARM